MQQDNFFNNKVTKRVKDVIIYSKEEAARLGNDSIAPEHVLLGIFRDGEGPAMAAFEELNVDESQIRFNKYNLSTYTSPEDNSGIQTAKIGFVANSKSFEVVRHKENGKWRVCDECTLFE